MPKLSLSAVFLLAFLSGRPSGAETPEPISYTLRFPAPQAHYVEVEAVVPTDGQAAVELMMAVWTPGSYLVREYSRNLEGLSAGTESGEALRVEKTAKNRWRVATRSAPRVVVRYRIYAREMSVRTDWVDADFAILNGAATFLTRVGAGRRPHDVRLFLPPEWKLSESPLPRFPAGGEHSYRAEDFDTLVDSPLYAGNAATYSFDAGGKLHLLVNEGEGTVWDGPRSAADAATIARQQIAFWGDAPYPRYVFFNLLTETAGGLEHRNACTLMTSRWRTRTREGYLGWLGLVSHEFFHTWNVKRLRPIELGPFDYEREATTRGLWIAEGLTSYYGALLVRRAGLSTQKEYLKELSKGIETLQTTPGRLVQPLEEASFDAWIKFYRPDENSPNSSVSYYTKGEVVGFLLDAKIRRATAGRKSLDDAMRLAYQRFSGERGFRGEGFYRTVDEVAGGGLAAWLTRAVESTEDLDYAEALDWYGLRFTEDPEKKEKEEPDPHAAWLGMETAVQAGRLVVTEVRRETPADAAGLNVGDEIVGIDDFRIPPDGLEERLKSYRPGERAALLVARRERLTRLAVTFGEKPRLRWWLEIVPDANNDQKARLAAWLDGSAAPIAAPAEKKTTAVVP